MSTMVPMYGFGGGGGKGAALTVNAPVGAVVTVSKDGKTKTKVADSSGLAVFKGLSTGDWTLSITDGTQTAQKTVTITADYSTKITFFSATIHVTYPAGSTCTATDGVTTLTAPDTSGTWDCVVPNAGTWTVTVADNSRKKTIIVDNDGQTVNVDLTKYYLYKSGDVYSDRTGGWTSEGIIWGGAASSVTPARFEADSILLIRGSSVPCVVTRNGIDLSGFGRLCMRYTIGATDNQTRFGVINSTEMAYGWGSSDYPASVQIPVANNGIVTVEVSGISSNLPVAITNHSTVGTTMTVYEVWIE